MISLTLTQIEILDYLESSPRSPTLDEICLRFDYRSTRAAKEHLIALEKKGRVETTHGARRSVRVVMPLRADERAQIATGRAA